MLAYTQIGKHPPVWRRGGEQDRLGGHVTCTVAQAPSPLRRTSLVVSSSALVLPENLNSSGTWGPSSSLLTIEEGAWRGVAGPRCTIPAPCHQGLCVALLSGFSEGSWISRFWCGIPYFLNICSHFFFNNTGQKHCKHWSWPVGCSLLSELERFTV